MTLPESALTTLAEVAGELGITVDASPTVDARLERRIRAASDAFARRANRSFEQLVDHIEFVAGFGNSRLSVREHLPVTAISDVTFDDGLTETAIDSTEFEVEDGDIGWIRNLDGNWSETDVPFVRIDVKPGNTPRLRFWRVTYTGGWVTPQQVKLDGGLTRTLPFDIEEAVIDLVTSSWRQRNVNSNIKIKRLGPGTTTFFDGNTMTSSERRASSVINTYRLRAVS